MDDAEKEQVILDRLAKWLNTQGYQIDLNDCFWMEEEYEIKLRDLCHLLNDYGLSPKQGK